MYRFIVVVTHGGSEGLIVTTRLGIHSLAMCNISLVRLRAYIYQHRRPGENRS